MEVMEMYKYEERTPVPLTHDQILAKIQRFYEHLTELELTVTHQALLDYYFILFAEILCDDYPEE